VKFYSNTKQQEESLNVAVKWMDPLLPVQDATFSNLGRKTGIQNETFVVFLSPSR
jgi:hypothetical protein